MSAYKDPLFTEDCFDVSYFKRFSPARCKAIALMAELGLPLHKIHHCIAIGDAALLIADEVEKQMGVKVDKEAAEIGALLHDIGISVIQRDDMPEHAFIGGRIARAAGYSEEIARCIELHDCAGLVKEYVEGLKLPHTVEKEDMLPETWEEKIVAYADMIISLEGEWRMDVWNDDTCPARAYYSYLSTPYQVRTGRKLTLDHPEFAYDIEFNKQMRRFAPRERYERELRPRIERMRETLQKEGIGFVTKNDWE